MNIELLPATVNDKPVLRNLLELYQYDFSEIEHSDVDEHGLYGYRYLDYYWTEPNRHAFLIRVDGVLAGFALVRGTHETAGSLTHSVAEFFVMRKYRRQGVGSQAAQRLFDLFPGRWKVAEEQENRAAQAFWRSVIAHYSHKNYEEFRQDDEEWRGLVQVFRAESGPDGLG